MKKSQFPNSDKLEEYTYFPTSSANILTTGRPLFVRILAEDERFSINIKTHFPSHLKLTSALSSLFLNHPPIIIRELCNLRPTVFYSNNLNVSNKYHKASRRKKTENLYDNFSSTLTSCFLGGCRKNSASSSFTSRLFKNKHSENYGTSMSVPSSILESQSSGFSIISQMNQKKTDDLSTLKVNADYEVTPRSFCQISQTIIIDPPTQYVLKEKDKNQGHERNLVVEVDCSPNPKMRTPLSSSWDEVLSSDWSFTGLADLRMSSSIDPIESRSILKRTTPPKSFSPSRLTFALSKNLVYEYPSYESWIDENNENNCRKNFKEFDLSQRLCKVFTANDAHKSNLLSHLMSLSAQCDNTWNIESDLIKIFYLHTQSAQDILTEIQRTRKQENIR